MMVEIVSVGYAVVSMIGWGCGDFLIKRSIGSIGYYRLLLYVQLVALGPIFLLAAVCTPPIPSSPRTIGLIFATGICGFSAMLFFFKALAVGKASIIAPVSSTSAVVAIALSFVILGERLSLSQASSIILVLVGIFALSMRTSSSGHSNAGIPYVLASVVCAGFDAVLIKLVSIDIGEIGTLFFTRVIVTLLLLLIFPFVKNLWMGDLHERVSLKSILAVGLASFAGILGFILGIGAGIVSIVAPISSASPVITVILAQLFLNEKMVQTHKIAVLLIIVGIILLSIVSV
jgi:drug/metabolite transporter (DMT)-like permease